MLAAEGATVAALLAAPNEEEEISVQLSELVRRTVMGEAKPQGWLALEIQNLDGKGLSLIILPGATVLQIKRVIAQEEGTPAFQQSLWAEGAEEELQNKLTAAESQLGDNQRVFLIKGDVARWQLEMINEPDLFEGLGDFMALSQWREKGGYERAGKIMDEVVAAWELPSSGLSKQELLRRKVVIGRWFVDCGGQFQRAIELLEAAAAEVETETEREVQEQEEAGTSAEDTFVLPLEEHARLHMGLGAAYAGRESAKQYVSDTVWVHQVSHSTHCAGSTLYLSQHSHSACLHASV
jgi:hypothetical protein